MKKLTKHLVVFFTMTAFLSSCTNAKTSTETENSKEVTFYGWGGDEMVNNWIDNYVAPQVAERYDIKLTRVGMNIDEILSKLSNEKAVNQETGDIDIVWLNGENFNIAKTYGLLSEPFADNLENFKYIDENSDYVNYDFNVPIEGTESPFGLSHLIFIGDTEKIDLPKSTDELLEVAKANPGTITYPAPPDFTGSAFARNVIYDIVGYEDLLNASNDKEEIKTIITPALQYLNELEPYLWEEGKTYPKEEAIMQKMYSDGQLYMTMSYTALIGPRNVHEGTFSKTSKTFVFDKGNIANCHHLTIPFNAPNKTGAMTVINFILSPEAQASKLSIENWGDLPVLDYSKLDTDQQKMFDDINKDYNVFDTDELMEKRLPEVDAEKISIIEELWEEEVLLK